MEFRDSTVYLYDMVIDLRSSYDRLSMFVEGSGKRSRDGSYYVFIGRSRKKVKILYWDDDGYCIWQKRLEAGRIRVNLIGGIEELSTEGLRNILRGMELERIKIRKKFTIL